MASNGGGFSPFVITFPGPLVFELAVGHSGRVFDCMFFTFIVLLELWMWVGVGKLLLVKV